MMRPEPAEESEQVFREEALRRHAEGRREGDLLRISPAWTGRAFLLLMAVIVTGALFALFGRIDEYAAGRAMVRLADRVDLTTSVDATCSSIDVRPGERVVSGQLLARFHEGPEAADLERTEREFNLLLIELLTRPDDPDIRQSLARLRSDRNWARSRLEELHRRAPSDGIVGDIRVRPGQMVRAGEVFMTLRGDGTGARVVALFPSRYGPELRPGMTMRLELDGYQYDYQDLKLVEVSGEALGPDAVRRVLGREAGEGIPITESVIIAVAEVPSGTFRARRGIHEYTDGMLANAEVRVRSQRIIMALLPGLRELFGHGHE